MSYNQAQIRNNLPGQCSPFQGHVRMKRCICNICSRTTSAAALRWQVLELTLKYENFEAKFRYQNQIGTPMIVSQILDICHIFNIYSFESRPASRLVSVFIFDSHGSPKGGGVMKK